MSKRVLIVGCGDLGIRVANILEQSADTKCWGVRRSPPMHPATDRFEWIAADITQRQSLKSLPENITDVIYCAAPGQRSEQEYKAVYFEGLQNVASSINLSTVRRILFISSTAVYGNHGDDWIDENTPTDPKAFNGRILVQTEQWLMNLRMSHPDLKTISLRLSGIYGPGRNNLLDRLKKGLASAPSENTHWVNRIHIDDAAAAIVHVMNLQSPSPLYLVTDSTPLPMRILYEELAKLVNGPMPPTGSAPAAVGSKRLSNRLLLSTGFKLAWPDSRTGHAAQLRSQNEQ